MKIAIPVANEKLCAHFGHCQKFDIITVNESKEIEKKESLTPPPHEPGVLPKWLNEQGVTLVIAGGMGTRAQSLFHSQNIKTIVGAPINDSQSLVTLYLENELKTGDNFCDH